MDREILDKIGQVSFLRIMPLTKAWLRFLYRDEMIEIKKGLSDIDKGIDIASKIRSFQKQKLIELCKFAYKNCEYYKEIFRKVKLDPNNLRNFDKIFTLDKQTIRKFEDKLIVKNLKPWQSYEAFTGGSTGEPLRLFLSPKVGIVDDVHQEYYLESIGFKKGDVIVSLSGNSVPANLRKRNIFWTLYSNSWPYGRIQYSSLYFNDKTGASYLDDLSDTRPAVIRGYPSAIFDVASYINSRKIKIPFKVKGIILTSEQAFDWQVNEIEKAFHTNVYFQYGHSEACIFAFSKENSREYMCSPFYGLTEVLNKEGKQVKMGSVGEIVVTGFYNYAMPFIRYRTGDMAVYGGTKDGVVILKELWGRTQDYVYGANEEKVPLTGLVFGQHYKAFRNIKKWQIIQFKKGSVLIKVVPDKYFGLKDKLEIKGKFFKLADTKVIFKYVNSIPLTKRGKYLFLIQKIKGN